MNILALFNIKIKVWYKNGYKYKELSHIDF